MTTFADFCYRMQAAVIDAILDDGTTADTLKANFNAKIEEVGRVLIARDPSLLQEAITIVSDPNFNPQTFIDEMMKSIPTSGKPNSAQASIDCKCPNLLNGHVKGCTYKP